MTMIGAVAGGSLNAIAFGYRAVGILAFLASLVAWLIVQYPFRIPT